MKGMMRVLWCVWLTMVGMSGFTQNTYREEYNGPFVSWANVQKRFGAAGNGIKDDTKALQTAIDSLTVSLTQEFNTSARTRYVVIYLPAGTYNISSTLRVAGKIGFSIIGEDPAKTVIRWVGGNNDTMLLANGSSYYKISRITWDPGKAKSMEGVGIHWLDRNGVRFAATSIELSDMVFKSGFGYGIHGGTYGQDGVGANDAEVAIRRCKFYGATVAGISIKGFNTLDYWIWDCEFNKCARGIQNAHGNYHAYNCHFYGSTVADAEGNDGYYTSLRGCYSSGAKAFSFDKGGSCNAFKRIFQQNIIEGGKGIPIEYYSQGRVTMIDNFFATRIGYTTMQYAGWCPATYQVLSIGNYFGDSIPYVLTRDHPTSKFTVDEKSKANAGVLKRPPIPALQPFLPYVKRTIFEVPAGSTAAAIQAIINKAAALKGQRPVVHFPVGRFVLQQAIEIPAGSDMQVMGDGILEATTLEKAPDSKDPWVFKINGPSYITIKDMAISSKGEVSVLFSNVDQPSSEVHIDQLGCQATTSLHVDRLNYTYFEKTNSYYSSGHVINGGSLVAQGKGTSRVHCFGAQGAKTRLLNNAVFVARDCWWEGMKKDYLPVDLEGEGRFTIDGALLAPGPNDSTPALRVRNFKGSVTLSDLYVYGGLDVENRNPDLKLLVWNVNFIGKQNPASFAKAGFQPQMAMLGITMQCSATQTATCKDENILSFPDTKRNIKDLNSFLRSNTTDLRAMPKPFRNIAGNVSNILLSRISVTSGNTALKFQP